MTDKAITYRQVDVTGQEVAPTSPDIATLESGVPTEIKQFLTSLRDQRLSSSHGVLSIVTAELGVQSFVESVVAEHDYLRFRSDLRLINNEMLRQAIEIVVLGFRELEKTPPSLPNAKTSRYDEPIATFRGALQLLDTYLDDQSGQRKLADNDVTKFKVQSWTQAWQEALGAAQRLQQACLGGVEVDGQKISVCGEAPHVVRVHDVDGKPVCDLKTVHIGVAELAHDQIKDSKMPPDVNAFIFNKPGVETPRKTFLEGAVSEKEYPDRTIALRANVERNIVFLPVDPSELKTLFALALNPNMQGPFKVDIVTGDAYCNDKLQVDTNEKVDGLVRLVLPSRYGFGGQEFFQGLSYSAFGEKKSAELAELGAETTSSVAVIFKPAIDASELYFRQDVLNVKIGKTSPEMFLLSHADSLRRARSEIIAKGILDEQAVDTLIATVTQRQRDADRLNARYSGGFRGGDSLMMSTRGFGGLGSGYSGVGTGELYKTAKRSLAVDPWTPPKIIVFRLAGVGPQELANQEALFNDLLLP